MENQEWADEEMSFKQVTNANPFTVPSGYFEDAGQRILSIARLQSLKSDDNAQGFLVPENYFNELGANIQSQANLIASAPANGHGFSVAEGYFEQLTANIQSRTAIETAVNSDAGSFTVPENYFEHLQQQVSARIAVEEVLGAVTNAFTVPENYFAGLNKNILNKTVNQDAVIRKTIVRKLFGSNTFKYATAACLALVIGTGLILKQAGTPPVHAQTLLHTQLSGVPVNEIKDYLELHVDATDTHGMIENDKINTEALDKDLQDYLDINN